MAAKFKSPLDAVIGLTESVTKEWTKQRKAEERDANARTRRVDRLTRMRRETIRDAAFQVMEEAYQHANTNGTRPVNPRQIYYAARRKILLATGRDQLQSNYFLQVLLRDYMEIYDCSDWDVIWDARGHFTEPHTGRVIPIGTLEVRQYLGDRPKLRPAVEIGSTARYPTSGPENRFNTVLFIEKEGFDPILEAAQIAERYDIGIMSTKGMSVSASRRQLLDRLVSRGVTKSLVLHDFDVSGFSIFGTLGTNSNVYRYTNKVPIFDLGLRLADVEDMDLLAEPFATNKDWRAISKTLKRHGATPAEIAFLADERVELNAMTSDEFIAFIEGKFAEHGVAKVVPDSNVIEQHARNVIEGRLIENAVAKLAPKIKEQAATVELPESLRQQIEAELKESPALSWDEAVADLVADLAERAE
jgi:DNA topoisomerase VI subunit A